jgi:chemotaxis family two-component system response regulator Rcp1
MIHVLLVEDDDIDALLVQDELKKIPVRAKVTRVRDGDECMAYLHNKAKRRPDVIFLDLKMPIKSGREVLAEMRVDPVLSIIPVVVLSGSDVDADRKKAYELGANGYVNKPGDRASYIDVMNDVWRYWLQRNRPPP